MSVIERKERNAKMDDEYIGKHAKINILDIPHCYSGACFHGEVWVRCPHCNKAHEMVGSKPLMEKDGYYIYRCSCGKLFKDK